MVVVVSEYYEALRLTKDAVDRDPSCVKAAYRRLALELHPDKTGLGSSERFQNIARANQVLSDRGLRAVVDEYNTLPGEPEELLEQTVQMFPGMDIGTAVGMLKIFVPEPSRLDTMSGEEFHEILRLRCSKPDKTNWMKILAGCAYLVLLIHVFFSVS